MDEPLGALDKNLREEMQYEIKHIHENLGVTIVYYPDGSPTIRTLRFLMGLSAIIMSEFMERPDNAFVPNLLARTAWWGMLKALCECCLVKTDHGVKVFAKNISVKNVGIAPPYG